MRENICTQCHVNNLARMESFWVFSPGFSSLLINNISNIKQSNFDMHFLKTEPVFQSKKISQILSPKEKKPPIVNNQCVVYKFQCDLCDTDYDGYTTRHLHQRIGEHKHSAIGRHLEDQGLSKSDLKDKQFSVK